jgi:hypothetical protein
MEGNNAVFGGAMYLKGLTATFAKSTAIRGNAARAIGGGIYLLGGHVAVMADVDISNNSAAQGGGVAWYSRCLEPRLCPSSLSIAKGAIVKQNHASMVGGGVFMEGALTLNYTAGLGVVVGNYAKLGDPNVMSTKEECDAVDGPQL